MREIQLRKKKAKTAKLNFNDPEVQVVVERIVKQKKVKYSFLGVTPDDIAQIIRIKSWKKLEEFDPSRGRSLEAFLGVCVDNDLKNYKRDNYVRYVPPCSRNNCPLFDRGLRTCLLPENYGRDPMDYQGCVPYDIYMKRIKEKLIVKSPVPLDVMEWGLGKEPSIEDKIDNDYEETVAKQVKVYGPKIYVAYKAMIANNVPQTDMIQPIIDAKLKKRVREVVEEVLHEMEQ